MHLKKILFLSFLILLGSCSTIHKKDCEKDMKNLGLSQGRAGSPKIFTDDLRRVCSSKNPNIDLEGYEKGFYQGWMEYCLPTRAFDMGKRSDRYISFCPEEREHQFREKYLLGKRYFELKDTEDELVDEMKKLQPTINTDTSDLDDYNKINLELEATRREVLQVEQEGKKDNVKFR